MFTLNKKVFLISQGIVMSIALLALPSCTSTTSVAGSTKEDKKETIKSIDEVVKKLTKTEGLFPLYQDPKNGDLYIEISQDQLGQQILYTSQIVEGVPSTGNNRGDFSKPKIIRFEKHYDRIEIIVENNRYYYDENNAVAKAKNANITEAIVVSEKLAGITKIEKKKADVNEQEHYLIKADSLFLQNNLTEVVTSSSKFMRYALGKISKEKSTIASTQNFPTNTVVTSKLVIDGNKGDKSAVSDGRSANVVVQHNLMLLPDNDFVPRQQDSRVGYISFKFDDMTSLDSDRALDLINHWRLVKKDPSAALSEPVKPITYWIENTTPYEYRETILNAALKWNVAFEAAGFKNAIVVKQQPDDATWSADDVRYNTIRWVSSPSARYGGFGPSQYNPLTGEILSANIIIEFSKFNYRITTEEPYMATGAPKIADGVINPKELKKLTHQTLANLVLHEMGHTLGLMHNFRASSSIAYKDLYKKTEEGTALISSVMDYASANIAPAGKTQGDYYSVMPGSYDLWAIKFGYDPELTDVKKRQQHLALSTQKGHLYNADQEAMRHVQTGVDPRVNTGDLSDDALSFAQDRVDLAYGSIKNLEKLYIKDGKSYVDFRSSGLVVFSELLRQADIASRFVGGVYVDRALAGQPGATTPYQPVPRATQKRAVNFLIDNFYAPRKVEMGGLFARQSAIYRRAFNGGNELPFSSQLLSGVGGGTFFNLLHPVTLGRVIETAEYGNEYPIQDLLADLTHGIFNVDLHGNVTLARQKLQEDFVRTLLKEINNNKQHSEVKGAMLSTTKMIQHMLIKVKGEGDKRTQNHRRQLLLKIDRGLVV
jgi:hypothetical protein